MIIKIKKLSENAILPTTGSTEAAGYDLYALEDCSILSHETVKVGTGLAMAIPEGYFGGIYARSGLATKQGLRPANCTGVVDADYRGEIIVALHNDSVETREIKAGERIAQLIIQKFEPITYNVVDELPSTKRGDGGFGSSGK